MTGFCMGGALTVLSSTTAPEADAAVVWYGVPPLDYVDASKIHLPMQGHFAIEDAFFPDCAGRRARREADGREGAARVLPLSRAARVCERDGA